MRARTTLGLVLGGAGAALALVLLMGATPGGFPSQPYFRAATVRRPAVNVELLYNRGYLEFEDTGGAADEKLWSFDAIDPSMFALLAREDDRQNYGIAMAFSRTGTYVDGIDFGTENGTAFRFHGTGPLTLGAVPIARTLTASTATDGSWMLPGDTILINKAAATSRATTTSLAADPDLQVTALPAGHYRIQAWLYFTDAAGGSGARPDVSSAANIRVDGIRRCAAGGATATAADEGSNLTCTGAGDSHRQWVGATEKGASGTLAIFWAQQASNAAATVLEEFSWLEVTRIE